MDSRTNQSKSGHRITSGGRHTGESLSKTFSEMASIGSSKPIKATIADQLAELTTKFNERFLSKSVVRVTPDRDKAPTRPFFADVKTNTFALLGPSDDAVEDDPWNAAIGLKSKGSEKNLKVERFDFKRNPADKEVVSFIVQFTARVASGNLEEDYYFDRSHRSKLSRLMVSTLASDMWSNRLGFDPLVPSEYLDVVRRDKESKAAFERRKTEFMKQRIPRFHNILASAIKESLTHDKARDESLSLVYILRQTYQTLGDKSQIDFYLQSIQKLSPTVAQLRRLGKIPDLKIGEYRNLFLLSEWEEISESPLFKAEAEMKALLKQKITPQSVEDFFKEVFRISESAKADALSLSILEKKRSRLVKAAIWKRNSIRPDSKMDVIKDIRLHAADEDTLRVFSPFDILASANARGSEEGSTRVRYDSSNKLFFWDSRPEGLTCDRVEKAGRELVSLLNS